MIERIKIFEIACDGGHRCLRGEALCFHQLEGRGSDASTAKLILNKQSIVFLVKVLFE